MFKFLTLIFFLLINFSAEAKISDSVHFILNKDFLRLELRVEKNQIVISHKENTVELKTLNSSWYDTAKKSFKIDKNNSKYISKIAFKDPTHNNNLSKITIYLKETGTELFSYYKDRNNKQIIDFWTETDSKEEPLNKDLKNRVSKKIIPIINNKLKINLKKKNHKKITLHKNTFKRHKEKKYRDFRYGAPFLWNYDALAPKIDPYLNISLKTPEYFFPIADVDYKKGEQQSHLQLSINLYRKHKWGLMYKSIKLYYKKFGKDKDYDLNEYLKINSILRQELAKGNIHPIKIVLNSLNEVLNKTKNYELKRAIFKYLLSYHLSKHDHIQVLKLSKQFYVSSKENFDYEESPKALEYILHSLAHLGQVEQVEKLSSEEIVVKLLPKQILIAYKSFVYLKLKKYNKLNKLFDLYGSSLIKPVKSSILFNIAESYFQQGELKKAIKLYDQFILYHSRLTKSSEARLRIALAYEMLETDIRKTIVLYKSAINHSQIDQTRFEARIRLAALLNIRKIKPGRQDKQYRSLLIFNERNKLKKPLEELLWLVKLRTYIVDKKYKFGMNYLRNLPLISLKASKRRVFIEDGTEIVYGSIETNYQKGKYAAAIKTWEINKNRYLNKVANDPYLNFIIGESYLRLSLYDSFEKAFKHFKKNEHAPAKTYPLWNRRRPLVGANILLKELLLVKAIKLNQIKKAKTILKKIVEITPTYPRNYFYKGELLFKEKNYRKAISQFELFLIMPKNNRFLTNTELVKLLNSYVESIYELKDTTKFLKVAKALSLDINLKGARFDLFKRKILYYQIEILVSADAKNKLIKNNILKYKKAYGFNNEYGGRVQYLLGQTFLNDEKLKDARQIFLRIIKDANIASYLKEMAKTDLSLITIKERRL